MVHRALVAITGGFGIVAGRLLPTLPMMRSGGSTAQPCAVEPGSGIHRRTVDAFTVNASAMTKLGSETITDITVASGV